MLTATGMCALKFRYCAGNDLASAARHQAQECFCGEPNCIGFIGGKTQTDFASMDDLYLDALGITDEADLMELKGTKKKKGKKIDDPDFMVRILSFLTSLAIFSEILSRSRS